ncbi:MAG TPA: cyclic nucleotide-binding domain-containing protein [Burkholderiales bacterium]
MAFETLLSIARPLAFAKGERLVRQGEPTRGAFLVREGRVEARVAVPGGDSFAVATLGEGDLFGEMALLERGVCSASVVALTNVTAAFVERDDFRALVASRDRAALGVQREITQLLAAKLRALNAKVREHAADEDRAPRDALPQRIDLSGAPSPAFDWRAFLPLLRFFEGFDAYEIEELAAVSRAIELPRGAWLFAPGERAESCFVVVRGAVEVVSRLGELERRVVLAGPGELVGYLAVLHGAHHAAGARVREKAALLEVPAVRFRSLYESSSGTAVRLQRAIHTSLLRSIARTNTQLTRLISAARLRGAHAEGRALEAARGSQIVDLVEKPNG